MNYQISDARDVLRAQDFNLFVHGVNCMGAFRSGIAKVVREEYPRAYEDYAEHVRTHQKGRHLLGTFASTKLVEDVEIVHGFTQSHYGYDGQRYVSYDAVDDLFKAVRELALLRPPLRDSCKKIVFPLVGAGLGGGDWVTIASIIDRRLEGLKYTCIVRPEDVLKYKLKNT